MASRSILGPNGHLEAKNIIFGPKIVILIVIRKKFWYFLKKTLRLLPFWSAKAPNGPERSIFGPK